MKRPHQVFNEAAGIDEGRERGRDLAIADDLRHGRARLGRRNASAAHVCYGVAAFMRAISRRIRSRQRMPSRLSRSAGIAGGLSIVFSRVERAEGLEKRVMEGGRQFSVFEDGARELAFARQIARRAKASAKSWSRFCGVVGLFREVDGFEYFMDETDRKPNSDETIAVGVAPKNPAQDLGAAQGRGISLATSRQTFSQRVTARTRRSSPSSLRRA